LSEPPGDFDLVKTCATVDEYAHSVFEFFRWCDREKIQIIYCETVPQHGIGLALMDRLKRAAES
jgi:L-threonylcarbamoyladenylate synthase